MEELKPLSEYSCKGKLNGTVEHRLIESEAEMMKLLAREYINEIQGIYLYHKRK